MKIKYYALILFTTLSIGAISGCSVNSPPRISHEHHKTEYVPWGTDEFEFFGFSRAELSKKFKDEMHLSEDDTAIAFDDGRPGHFHLGFDENGKVCSVHRVFIDGAGCEIFGPCLESKEQALKFSIDGLSRRSSLDKDDTNKLSTARKQLEALSSGGSGDHK